MHGGSDGVVVMAGTKLTNSAKKIRVNKSDKCLHRKGALPVKNMLLFFS